jgi:hypothetical protein
MRFKKTFEIGKVGYYSNTRANNPVVVTVILRRKKGGWEVSLRAEILNHMRTAVYETAGHTETVYGLARNPRIRKSRDFGYGTLERLHRVGTACGAGNTRPDEFVPIINTQLRELLDLFTSRDALAYTANGETRRISKNKILADV